MCVKPLLTWWCYFFFKKEKISRVCVFYRSNKTYLLLQRAFRSKTKKQNMHKSELTKLSTYTISFEVFQGNTKFSCFSSSEKFVDLNSQSQFTVSNCLSISAQLMKKAKQTPASNLSAKIFPLALILNVVHVLSLLCNKTELMYSNNKSLPML
jgi:hypothetical protein